MCTFLHQTGWFPAFELWHVGCTARKSMTPGHPTDAEISALTLSFLRFGSDTRGPRAFKSLLDSAAGGVVSAGALAASLRIPESERPHRLAAARARASEALDRAAKADLRLLSWYDADYPELLRQMADPPIVLWWRGDPGSLSLPAVAIVGSRRATPGGVAVARKLARGVAEAGLVVVSGLARGIDAAAHLGALDAAGRTIGVLGSGADVIYPPEHRSHVDRICTSGAVLSEFPPGTPPLAHHFPMRNRIISGLCKAVIVVEASHRSGSLITARLALEQGRDVYAVPGSVSSGQYAGSHALIKDGAPLVETVEDVLDALGMARPAVSATAGAGRSSGMSRLEAVMAVGEPYTIDQLAARTGLATSALLAELGGLEVAGRIGRAPGAGFVKVDKSAIGEGHG